MRIGVIKIHVDDQDKARDFYTRVVGLQVKTDLAYGETARWLTVVSPKEPTGTGAVPRRASADAVRRDRRRLRRRLREPPQPRPELNRWTTYG
jgi:catechol 2,3-dioxygenase-like lactoylglutathione lyase family enzyme